MNWWYMARPTMHSSLILTTGTLYWLVFSATFLVTICVLLGISLLANANKHGKPKLVEKHTCYFWIILTVMDVVLTVMAIRAGF
jgi:hypothetical protein